LFLGGGYDPILLFNLYIIASYETKKEKLYCNILHELEASKKLKVFYLKEFN
jgi:hypothetical protein